MPCLSTHAYYAKYNAKKHRGIVRSVQRWLGHAFKAPAKVKVSIICMKNVDDEPLYGITYKVGKDFIIKIEKHTSLMAVLGTLLHEYAHVRTWRSDSMVGDHGDEFYLELGRIERAWDELYETLLKDVK